MMPHNRNYRSCKTRRNEKVSEAIRECTIFLRCWLSSIELHGRAGALQCHTAVVATGSEGYHWAYRDW